MRMKKAMKYTGENVKELLNNFNIKAEDASVNVANQSLKLGPHNATRLHVGEWLVASSTSGSGKTIVADEIVQNILQGCGLIQ